MTIKTTIQLAATFTDTTLPKDRVDPVLPDAGALYLMDLMHPGNPAGFPAAGVVPADTTALHNIAYAQAAAMIGSGDATSLALGFRRGGFADNTIGRIERTAKGGVHVFTKKATDPGFTGGGVASAYGVNLVAPVLARDWIFNNPGHVYYFSVWGRVTRASTAGSPTNFVEMNSFSLPSANYRAQVYTTNGGGGALPAGNVRAMGTGPGPVLGTIASAAWAGSAPAAATGINAQAGILGVTGLVQSSAAIRQGKADQVIYRVYGEDLTVSGRSYAAVDALDLAQYTKDCLTAGGRFFGDTFTDPTVLP